MLPYSLVLFAIAALGGATTGCRAQPKANGQYFVKFSQADIQGAVPANGTQRIPLPAKVTYLELLKALTDIRPGAVVALAGGDAPLSVRATGLSGAPYPNAAGSVEFVFRRADGAEKKVSEQPFTTGPDGVWRGKIPAPEAGT